ncbi:WXG100 family type VII secretion target, partial [Streptomyces sp. ME03-5684b]|uniref:WXG100 family type VII secretion target n=1 Tax=Streptomyces sp. ME03-5684b TaxID=3028681 RepID=UPI0029AF0102
TTPDGHFQTQHNINGHPTWGTPTNNGGFLTEDGTTYVDPTGKTTHGLTAPDGTFLPNGQTRDIDGQHVYGTQLDDGSFLSQDGTTLITPDGTTQHGRTTPDGHFQTQHNINGHPTWGTPTNNGGFLTEDGKTYVDPSGKVEHGISAPDGTFIPGGTTRTLPDGTVVYGSMAGDDFFSSDGHTLVLDDGTVLHGSTDKNTGIFTGDHGNYYFVGESGARQGTPQDDGSLLLNDGSRVMTPYSWMVDLQEMAGAILKVRSRAEAIEGHVDAISSQYSNVRHDWSSPAGTTFDEVSTQAEKAMSKLGHLLTDMLERMQITHDNYERTELANVNNVTE